MAGDSHDGLVSRTGFRQLSNECMSQIMEPRRNLSFSTDAVPGRLETGDRLRRINLTLGYSTIVSVVFRFSLIECENLVAVLHTQCRMDGGSPSMITPGNL
jgi:hypothetical protein